MLKHPPRLHDERRLSLGRVVVHEVGAVLGEHNLVGAPQRRRPCPGGGRRAGVRTGGRATMEDMHEGVGLLQGHLRQGLGLEQAWVGLDVRAALAPALVLLTPANQATAFGEGTHAARDLRAVKLRQCVLEETLIAVAPDGAPHPIVEVVAVVVNVDGRWALLARRRARLLRGLHGRRRGRGDRHGGRSQGFRRLAEGEVLELAQPGDLLGRKNTSALVPPLRVPEASDMVEYGDEL
eukprot:560326-Pyramimonas_sp.AAC.1